LSAFGGLIRPRCSNCSFAPGSGSCACGAFNLFFQFEQLEQLQLSSGKVYRQLIQTELALSNRSVLVEGLNGKDAER